MSFTMDETYLGQNNADSLDEFPPLMTPLGVSAHQVNTGLTYDPYEFNKIAPYRSRSPCLRWPKKEPGVSHSVSSIDTECSNEDEQRHVCQECNKLFKNLQELDQHAKKTPHRAWRCAEPFCDKTYARRDTFLRHRATHKDKSHPCPVCPRLNKQKVFKRKDHLREHIRNCHSKVIEATGVESVRSGGDVIIPNADSGKCTTATVVKSEGRKQAMDRVVESLQTVMSNAGETILGQLGDRLTGLSEPEMEQVASNMAKAALETPRETSVRRANGRCVATGQ